ncbi:MAG: nitroreductase family protein [Deltaproteobacteria bacterium]|nr:nitroreductase family protein [Deltaproteobacteria bacterium]
MSILSIDETLCTQDGLCAAECPVGILYLKEGQTPRAVRSAGELCIRCGHCVAVCPTGAFNLKGMAAADCPPVRKEWKLSPEAAEHFLRSRRSVRNFKDAPADKDALAELIRVASHAPSGHNSQPVSWIVVHEREKVRQLAGMVVDWMRWMLEHMEDQARAMHMDLVAASWDRGDDRVLRDAPHLVVAHAPKAFPPSAAACTLALGYLELYAPALGLGTCWAGYFTAAATYWPPLAEKLALPEGNAVFGAVMAGIPKWGYHRLPLRKKPKIEWK